MHKIKNTNPDQALEATLEMPQATSSKLGVKLGVKPGAHGPVAVVKGTGPELSSEMQGLLRWRLRIAALVLFGGFGIFLLYTLVFDWQFYQQDNTWLIALSGVTALLGLLGAALCNKSTMSTGMLRVHELLIFAAPAALFVLVQWNWILDCSVNHQMIPSIVGPWFLLMFTYVLFIPSTWKRSAVVLGIIATIPLGLLVMLWRFDAVCAKLLSTHPDPLIEQALLLMIAASAGSIGTHTIGSLRREAFEARQLGQYRLKQLIGAGGMGEVHLAEHQMMKRPCAIKLIHPDKAGDPQVLARFEREVRATAQLSHWNTVEIFDYGQAENGAFYYVMEYLPGLSLAELIEQHGPLPPARVIYLIRQVCEALQEAHSVGLIHRDIKPGNIFAARRGGLDDVAKLLDFGLVKPVAELGAAHITQEGTIAGSPLYIAPEQATSEADADQRSDIYSLGAVMYHMLTGRPPFEADRTLKVLMAHAHEEVVPPSQRVAGLPKDLEQIVLKCLEKVPADRYLRALDLAAALSLCQDHGGWGSEEARQWWIGITRSDVVTNPDVDEVTA
ncbi:MAG: serine/threonine protein kinase [Planctomycetales bacterium]